MKIFLTGATGNFGIPVLQELIRQGHEVTCLVRKPMRLEGCETIVGDLSKVHRFATQLSESEGIIHLASPRSLERDVTLNDDILATGYLLDHWQQGNYVYTSSQTVYGIPKGDLAESNLINPGECWYDIAKIVNEFQIREASYVKHRKAGISVRPSLLFGSGSRSMDRQFLPYVLMHCVKGSRFIFDSEEGLESYGSSFLGERDCALAIVDSLKIVNAGAYNLTSGFCTWKQLIETIDKYAGTASRIIIKPGAVAEKGEFRLPQSRSYMDPTKFEMHTDFVPTDDLDELVGDFVKKYRDAKW